MTTPASRLGTGEHNGSTPRVVVTTTPGLPPIRAKRLFQEPWRRILRNYFIAQLIELRSCALWRAALVESILTGLWIFGSILLVCGSLLWGSDPVGRTIFIACVWHIVMFIVTISSVLSKLTCPQLNPAVTFMFVMTGTLRPASGLVFIAAECIGGILTSLAAKEILPQDRKDLFLMAGCVSKRTYTFNGIATPEVGFSVHGYFLAEFMFSFFFLYLTYLICHPKQLKILGFKWATVLISSAIGLFAYISATLRNGYSGSVFNPARCLGPAVAYGQPLWDRLWVPFFAPFLAATAVGFVALFVPADHLEVYAAKQDIFSNVKRLMQREADDSQPDDPQNSTLYEVPSAGRLYTDSPLTFQETPHPQNGSMV